MGKISDFVQKIKQIKNLELYVAFGLALVVVVLVFVFPNVGQNSLQNVVSSQSYIADMENKLVTVLDQIDGVDNVKVAISYSADGEKVYAYETVESKVDGKVTETSTLVTIKGEPLVVQTLTPKIDGVVVVASGNLDAVTKQKIKLVVVTLFNIDGSCVQVLS